MLYLEDYLEMIEHLPQELRDRFTEMREMDLSVQNAMDVLDKRVRVFFGNAKRLTRVEKEMEHESIRREYYKTLEDADEKVQLANHMYELVDRYLRRLDSELFKFKIELEADNSGITEILEKRSLELDAPPISSREKENRYSFGSRSSNSHGKQKKRRDSSASNQGPEKRPSGERSNSHSHSHGHSSHAHGHTHSHSHGHNQTHAYSHAHSHGHVSAGHAHRDRDSHSHRENHGHRDSHGHRETHSHRDSHGHAHRDSHRDSHGHRERDSHRERESHGHRESHHSRESHRDSHAHRDRDSHSHHRDRDSSRESHRDLLSQSQLQSSSVLLGSMSAMDSRPGSAGSSASLSQQHLSGSASPSPGVSYSLGHVGAGGSAIAAAASQAIAATQQMQQGRRTASLKASYEAAIAGVHTNDFGLGGREIAGAAQTALAAIQDVPKKKKKSSSSSSQASAASTSAAMQAAMSSLPVVEDIPMSDVTDDGLIDPNGDSLVDGENVDWTYDPNEPRYCLCNQVSYGDMVACDNEDCPFEWFHYPCVGITAPPKGKWYCPQCASSMKRRGRKN